MLTDSWTPFRVLSIMVSLAAGMGIYASESTIADRVAAWQARAANRPVNEALWLHLEHFDGQKALHIIVRRDEKGWQTGEVRLGMESRRDLIVKIHQSSLVAERFQAEITLSRPVKSPADEWKAFGNWREDQLRVGPQLTHWLITSTKDAHGRLIGNYVRADDPRAQSGSVTGLHWTPAATAMSRLTLIARKALGKHDLYLLVEVQDQNLRVIDTAAPYWNKSNHVVHTQSLIRNSNGFAGSVEIILVGDGYVPTSEPSNTPVKLQLNIPKSGTGSYTLQAATPLESAEGELMIWREALSGQEEVLNPQAPIPQAQARHLISCFASAELRHCQAIDLWYEPYFRLDPPLPDRMIQILDPDRLPKPPVIGNRRPEDPDFGPGLVTPALPLHAGRNRIDRSLLGWHHIGTWRVTGPLPPAGDIVGCPGALSPLEDLPLGALVYQEHELSPGTATVMEAAVNTQGVLLPNNRKSYRCRLLAVCELDIPEDLPQAWIGIRANSAAFHSFDGGGRTHARVWLNGAPLWVSDSENEYLEERAAILPMPLLKGTHRLFFEIIGGNRHTWPGIACHLLAQGSPLTVEAYNRRNEDRSRLLSKNPLPALKGFRDNFHGTNALAQPPAAWDLETGSNVRWQVPLPTFSNATPLIVGGKVFTLGEPGVVYCFDADTGIERWRSAVSVREDATVEELLGLEQSSSKMTEAIQVPSDDESGDGQGQFIQPIPSSGVSISAERKKHNLPKPEWGTFIGVTFASPTSDGQCLVVKLASGAVAAFALDGRRLWSKAVPIKPEINEFSSPLIVGDRVLMRWAHEKGSSLYKALSVMDGNEIWRTIVPGSRCGGTPLPLRLANASEYLDVLATPCGSILRIDDGVLLTSDCGHKAFDGYTIPSLIDNLLIYPESAGVYTGVRVVMENRDRLHLLPVQRPLWFGSLHGSFFGSHYGAVFRNRYYASSVTREHDLKRPVAWHTLNVVDTASGALVQRIKPALREASYGFAACAIAGSRLYITDAGRPGSGCFLGKGRPSNQESQIGVFDLDRGCLPLAVNMMPALQAPLAFERDRIYIRTHTSLVCIAPTDAAYESRRAEEELLAETQRIPKPLRDVVVRDISPPAEVQVPEGAPVVGLEDGRLPLPFLVLGPLENRQELSEETLRRLPIAEQEALGHVWRVCPLEVNRLGSSLTGSQLDVLSLFGRRAGTGGILAIGMRIDRRTCVRVQVSQMAKLYLAGVPLKNGELLRLSPGVYPLMVQCNIERLPPPSVAVRVGLGLVPVVDPIDEQLQWLSQVEPLRPSLQKLAEREPTNVLTLNARQVLNGMDEIRKLQRPER